MKDQIGFVKLTESHFAEKFKCNLMECSCQWTDRQCNFPAALNQHGCNIIQVQLSFYTVILP